MLIVKKSYFFQKPLQVYFVGIRVWFERIPKGEDLNVVLAYWSMPIEPYLRVNNETECEPRAQSVATLACTHAHTLQARAGTADHPKHHWPLGLFLIPQVDNSQPRSTNTGWISTGNVDIDSKEKVTKPGVWTCVKICGSSSSGTRHKQGRCGVTHTTHILNSRKSEVRIYMYILNTLHTSYILYNFGLLFTMQFSTWYYFFQALL